MKLNIAKDIQFGNFPVVQAWRGNTLIWNRGLYWVGLGNDNNWSTDNNWSGLASPVNLSPIQFGGITRLNAFNNLAIDTTFIDITFASSAGPFQLSGNRFIMGSGGITNNSVNAQTINNDVKLGSGVNYINANTGNITFNGLLSGSGSIIKTGNSTVNVSVARTISTGSVTISAGTFQYNNSPTNGGFDGAGPAPIIYNLNGNGATFNIFTSTNVGGQGRISLPNKIINFSSVGSQTVSITGNILFNGSTFVTNGGLKNYISGLPVNGTNFFNAQFTSITYNIADGIDDVDLEVSANMHFQKPIKTGAGKLSIVAPYTTNMAGPLTISAGTFDVGGMCSFPLSFTSQLPQPPINTIANNATFSYSSSVNSNCSNYVISGTGNLIKSGTSTLTLSADICSYIGSTSIINGSIIITKNIATATFTPTTLTINFSTPPNIGDTFRFFSGSTIQSYSSVSLIGAPARTASYNSTNSILTINS